MDQFSYRGFFWSIGTTSYRTRNFNKNIELQLQLISEFWALKKNIERDWDSSSQTDYYYFLQSKGFLIGEADRPDKDAREKTSGLADIGLIDRQRKLTEAGQSLLKMSAEGDFEPDNILEIPKDSYLYLRQMLKTSINVENSKVRPFVIFLYAQSRLGFITLEEFTYLLPLCIDRATTEQIISSIENLRENKLTVDNVLLSLLMSKEKYKAALDYLNANEATEEVICAVGMNRKSKNYDKPYFPLYKALYNIAVRKNNSEKAILELSDAVKSINGKARALWKHHLFKFHTELNNNKIFNSSSEAELKKEFFGLLHLFKLKSTLADYMDLNRRYFKITDAVLFVDGKVELDILPKKFFDSVANELLEIAFSPSENLGANVAIEKISPQFAIEATVLYASLGAGSAEHARTLIKNEKYSRLDKLIDEKFSVPKLVELFSRFESRQDNFIIEHITDNADVPTLFEYVVGIAWYLISERRGDILEYMNLSLDADLLPKSHAAGGSADIEYIYEKTSKYPCHCLLIEVTLCDDKNQRRMEMEPVSRHLGDYLLKTKEADSYCVFVSTYLHINVISDFRSRKTYSYYDNDGRSIEGLKILPLGTNEIKTILEKGLCYGELYELFEKAHSSPIAVPQWYKSEIVGGIA